MRKRLVCNRQKINGLSYCVRKGAQLGFKRALVALVKGNFRELKDGLYEVERWCCLYLWCEKILHSLAMRKEVAY